MITYEASHDEPVHPDPQVAQRFIEAELGPCENGCKIYEDPISSVRVLAHNRIYGCRK